MRIFFSIFLLCLILLLFTLNLMYQNPWVLIAIVSAVIAAILTALYSQQEKLEALEKRLEQLEKTE